MHKDGYSVMQISRSTSSSCFSLHTFKSLRSRSGDLPFRVQKNKNHSPSSGMEMHGSIVVVAAVLM